MRKRNPILSYPTLILAVMHWLSELVRYNPAKFDRYMQSKHNWCLHEFIEKSVISVYR